jgi:DNA-binding Lrp family transcriptional regulator
MVFPVKQVQTFEERLRIIEEVEKNPSKKRTDIAKRLGLPPSTIKHRWRGL